MTSEELRQALIELGWKQADLCRRIGMGKNTVSTWAAKGAPEWLGEYLRALLAIERLHREFVAPARPAVALPPPPVEKKRRESRAANLAKRAKGEVDLFAGDRGR
jgi:transcriptional regulator with XRE-family HTH domain